MNSKSNNEGSANDAMCCANCGKVEVDDVKLKICTACKLVKYCSVDCQKNHRPQHKKACKKRAAEIRDVQLFTQPDESYLGECPICCLPLPLDTSKSGINSCCSKRICDGCNIANKKREQEEGMDHRCAYCREPLPDTEEEAIQNERKRAKANDPIALCQVGVECEEEGDIEGAIQYYSKAAELGNMSAHYNLSLLYGEGVEKDMKKEMHHLEEAAIGGHAGARWNLGLHEEDSGRIGRAMKHFIIAANLGYDEALDAVKMGFMDGVVSKEDFEAALRGHQAAVDATKSQQREEAYEYYQQRNQN
jgi:TPR repeat protein